MDDGKSKFISFLRNCPKALYLFLQLSWGSVQSLIGFFVFLFCRVSGKNAAAKSKTVFRGAVLTEWKYRGGLSLGLFIFTPPGKDRMAVHEYGHTFQSLLLGPLYLPLVGLPSLLWAGLPVFEKRRREKRISYYSFYTEKSANYLGFSATGVIPPR